MNYVGIFGTLTPGSTHTYVITATDKLGNTSTQSGSFTVPAATTPTAGPVISAVAFNYTSGLMSWNEADPTNGVAAGTVAIDGTALAKSKIYGPYSAASGVNYVGIFGTLTPGSTHTYVITATDKLGNTSTLSGSFTVPGTSAATQGPAISQVAFNFASGLMSWNEADPTKGVGGGQLSIDGTTLPKSSIYGPYTATSGVNYVGVFGTLTAGSTHTYVITATDKLGNTSTLSGSFTVPAASGGTNRAGPDDDAIVSVGGLMPQVNETAKLAWLYDDSAAVDGPSPSTNAVDAALASY